MANLTGTVINYGEAPYQNKPENNKSFFVEVENLDGKRETRWGLDFAELIKTNNVQIGDKVNFIDMGKDEETKRHKWEFEFYEPLSHDLNSIEFDDGRDVTEQEQVTEQQTQQNQKRLQDFGDKLPSSIELNYVAVAKNRLLADEKINYYERTDTTSIAFEDRKNSLHTSRVDDKTIHAMLDLASSKGWSSIKLKGTEEFKQKAWLEASLRGIETNGYKPNERDLAELQAKQAERTVNNIEALEVKPLQREEIEIPKSAQNIKQMDIGVSQNIQGIEQPVVMDIQDINQRDYDEIANKALGLDNQQALAVETAKEMGFDNQQQALAISVLSELNHDKDYQNSNYVDKSNMIMTEISGLINKSISDEQYIDFAEKFESKTKEIALEQNMSVSNSQQKEWQNQIEIKENIINQIQQAYRAGEFKSRDDVINKLSEMGYSVVRQRDDGLSIENPNNVEKTIALTGDLVRANYHEAIANINELKEQLKPENLTQNHPNLNENQLAMIKTAFAELNKPDYKTDPSGKPVPEKFEAILNEFSRNVNELAQGKIAELPMPTFTETPKIEIKTPDHGSQDRSR